MSGILDHLSIGFGVALSWNNILVAAIGSFFGTMVGVLRLTYSLEEAESATMTALAPMAGLVFFSLLAVIGMAAQTNALVSAMQVPSTTLSP